jgi:hypothetical protein
MNQVFTAPPHAHLLLRKAEVYSLLDQICQALELTGAQLEAARTSYEAVAHGRKIWGPSFPRMTRVGLRARQLTASLKARVRGWLIQEKTVPVRRDEERHNRCGLLPVQSGGNGSGDGLRRAVDTLIEMVLMHANGAHDEFTLAATAQNLRKMAKLIPMQILKPA